MQCTLDTDSEVYLDDVGTVTGDARHKPGRLDDAAENGSNGVHHRTTGRSIGIFGFRNVSTLRHVSRS